MSVDGVLELPRSMAETGQRHRQQFAVALKA
jgi:hypothetical protein